MQEQLAEIIQSTGFWRVNVRPRQPIEPQLTMTECHERVAKASVRIRGWDYPHIQTNPDHGGSGNVGSFAENWCNWNGHLEFWRMYRSAQFLHYRALWEDTADHTEGNKKGSLLGVVGAIYTITEIAEFVSRLYKDGLYQAGASISVTLGNTAGRQLWVDDRRRMPFFDEKRTDATELVIEREVSNADFHNEPSKISLSMILELFDHFGWNPDPLLIKGDQERFYKREW